MLTVSLLKANRGEFQAYCYCDELTEEQITKLRLEITDKVQKVQLEGEYSVIYDSGFMDVSIDYLKLVNGDNEVIVKSTEYDYDTLCEEILEKDNSPTEIYSSEDYYDSYDADDDVYKD